MHDDAAQKRERGLQSIPDPFGENFTRGVGQALDVVQVVVIESKDEGIDDALDIAVVDEIPLGRVDFAFDAHIESERMPVQPTALVPLGERWQLVGGLEGEGFLQANAHRGGHLMMPRGALPSQPIVSVNMPLYQSATFENVAVDSDELLCAVTASPACAEVDMEMV
jgi:hypothetical protein